MEKAGFAAFADYAAAKLVPGELEALKRELTAFNNELTATRDRYARAIRAARD